MRDNRLILSKHLREITPNVYFQKPPNDEMKYPCILYRLNKIDINYADNAVYSAEKGYNVIVVDEDPDSPLVTKLLETFSKIAFDRFYIADDLNHTSFVVYI